MTFPEQPHIVFLRNPIEEAICQLKFPSLLKIDAEHPVSFQESIRAAYPLYEETLVNGGIAMPPELARLFAGTSGGAAQIERKFSSADGNWVVSLAREFIAVSTTKYIRWSDFRGHIEGPLAALNRVYAPAFFSRIGLRYRNVIRRSDLGLADASWSDLLKPYVAGALADSTLQGSVVHAAHQVGFRLDQFNAHAQLRHGLTKDEEGKERGYIIDIDFYTEERTELANALEVLPYLNGQAHRLFGWCISDTLREALHPQPVVAG